MLLEINTGDMKLKFIALAFVHSKSSYVFVYEGNLNFLTYFSQHSPKALYVEGLAECGRDYRGE